MQSRVCARAAQSSAARLRLVVSRQRPNILKASVFASSSRLHTSTTRRSNEKKYPELDDILGKPATSFSELVDQLEILIKHPNPPRNYADALAKEELRRSDMRDLTLDPEKAREKDESAPARLLLQQRPRLARQPTPDDGLDIDKQLDDIDNSASADLADLDAKNQTTNGSSTLVDADDRRAASYEVPPLSKGDAANLGITAEQQERRRIWMTKIAGYRNFRSSMMSMEKMLEMLDRDDVNTNETDGSAGGTHRNGKSADSDGAEGTTGDLLAELDEKNSAAQAEDREFEDLIRRSWRLHDEDLSSGIKETEGNPSNKPPASLKQTGGSKRPKNKRPYHTSRVLCDGRKPDNSGKPQSSKPNKPRGKTTSMRETSRKIIGLAKSVKPKGKERHISPKPPLLYGKSVTTVRPRCLVKPVLKHSKESIKRHVSESNAVKGQDVMPIGASVSTGDLIELRFAKESIDVLNSASDIRAGFVIQKTSGRFHFNVMTLSGIVLGAREQRLGFVASGVLFDEEFLRSTGIRDDDINRFLEYGRELREFEDTHGREAVVSASEAARILLTSSQKALLEGVESEIKDLDDMSASAGSNDLEVDVLGQAYTRRKEDVDTDNDAEESFADFVFRVVPTVTRHFKEQADALLLSHYRELKGYYDLAARNGQKHVTVDGLARLIFRQKGGFRMKDGADEPISETARFAAYMHLINDPLRFIPDIHVFYTCSFELRDPKEVKEILNAKEMIRRQSPEFKHFLETAQKLVSYSHTQKPDVPLRSSLDVDADSIHRNTKCDLTGWNYELFLFERNIPCDPAPTKMELKDISFSSTCQLFIRILTKFVFYKNEGYANLTNPYQFAVSPILKKMGVYGALDVASVVRFLVDIGVWPSWFNPSANIRRYQFGDFANGTPRKRLSEAADAFASQYLADMASSTDKQSDSKTMPTLDSVSDLVPPVNDNILTKTSDGKGVLKASEFYDHDICKAIRHNFGNLPVYTIDSRKTRDVDDGVSLETIKGANGEDKTWLHIHIADPTALIHPGHILSESAKLSGQSVYAPEMASSMMPRELLESTLSLSSHSNGMPTYTLTFSVLLSDDGDIAEYKVRPGVAHSPTPIPYDAVDKFARFDPKRCIYSSFEDVQDQRRHSTLVHPFTPSDYDALKSAEGASKLSERTVSDLRRIQEIAMRHHAYRIRQGSFTRVLPELNIDISDAADLVFPGPVIGSKPAFLKGSFMTHNYDGKVFPKITSVAFPSAYTPAHVLVSELMIIAGRTAARFSYEHNSGFGSSMVRNGGGVVTEPSTIPLLYRSQERPDLDSLSGINPGLPVPFEGMSSTDAESSHTLWNAVLDIGRERGGIVEERHFDEIRHMLNPSVLQSSPGPHTIMGIFDKHGYMRITSPLRRVEDLISHWQIKAQLLAEHTNAKDKMPWYWKHADIDIIAPKVYYATVATSKFSGLCEEVWGHTLVQRMEYQARRGKLKLPPPGFYDTNSPFYQDTPWAYYNPQRPGPLVWTATVDNRSELRPFISLIIKGIATRAMLIPRPVDIAELPFAGTKVRVHVIGVEPHKQILMVRLAPEELQPAETPRFWRLPHALAYLPQEISNLRTPP
ncbi:3'-5' RNA exonuclease complex component [Coemansia sp. RSA 1813]|nr:3'-5' RNA exonuclease complex component [Coemansia sp. RSA 1843]KAJ2211717.1 3'-5' RNA exonuclease complex component [Coemansia sp. RSA 487]KAJ2566644.1 3'-5' RNA exonuclease complex component [Coemansia sp. RSA 1813]